MMSANKQQRLNGNRLMLVRNLQVTDLLLAALRGDYTLTSEMQNLIEVFFLFCWACCYKSSKNDFRDKIETIFCSCNHSKIVFLFQQAEKTSGSKAGKLIDIIMKRGDKAFERLIYALIESDQDQIALELDQDSASRFIRARDDQRKLQESTLTARLNQSTVSVPGTVDTFLTCVNSFWFI